MLVFSFTLIDGLMMHCDPSYKHWEDQPADDSIHIAKDILMGNERKSHNMQELEHRVNSEGSAA
jgi:hypothetical protein